MIIGPLLKFHGTRDILPWLSPLNMSREGHPSENVRRVWSRGPAAALENTETASEAVPPWAPSATCC